MIDVTVLKALAASGATIDQIIAAVEADQAAEIERRAEKRRKNAERKRRERERHAMSRGQGVTTCDIPPPSSSPLTLPLITTPTSSPSLRSGAPEVVDPETDLFRRGKELLGKEAGGLIKRLLNAKNGSIPLARAALEVAATKHDRREYIGAVIRGPEIEKQDWRSALR